MALAKRIGAFPANPVTWVDRSCIKHHKRNALLLNSTPDLLTAAFRRTCILLRIHFRYRLLPSSLSLTVKHWTRRRCRDQWLHYWLHRRRCLSVAVHSIAPPTSFPAWHSCCVQPLSYQRRPSVLAGISLNGGWPNLLDLLQQLESHDIQSPSLAVVHIRGIMFPSLRQL